MSLEERQLADVWYTSLRRWRESMPHLPKRLKGNASQIKVITGRYGPTPDVLTPRGWMNGTELKRAMQTQPWPANELLQAIATAPKRSARNSLPLRLLDRKGYWVDRKVRLLGLAYACLLLARSLDES